MRFHQKIDLRGPELARHVVSRIEEESARAGLEKARSTCLRWLEILPESQRECVAEWLEILGRSWAEVRRILLDPGAEGNRLRQNSPFCGILTPQERWQILKEYKANESQTA